MHSLMNVLRAGDCKQIGMFQSQFDRYNKIVSLEMMFDVMGYMQQIQVTIHTDIHTYIHRKTRSKVYTMCIYLPVHTPPCWPGSKS
jgi:hypothetical protein